MSAGVEHCFSGPLTAFQERRLPEAATPAGYAALIGAYELTVPPGSCVRPGSGDPAAAQGLRGRRLAHSHPATCPRPDSGGPPHLCPQARGAGSAVLKRLFAAVGPSAIEALVRATPTGSDAQRIWFLYEWLTGERLDLPDAVQAAYVPAVDPEQQWALEGRNPRRHRVRDNLPGTPAFCPLVFRTPALEEFVAMNLAERARAVVADVPRNLLARTAAFLLLKDSKSSLAIEGERPAPDRIQRWGRASLRGRAPRPDGGA